MGFSAPRISPRLVAALERLDDESLPIAEICRRLGAQAELLELPRPSYERVRVLVHELRAERARPTTAAVLIDISLRARPPEALVDHLSGIGVPKL